MKSGENTLSDTMLYASTFEELGIHRASISDSNSVKYSDFAKKLSPKYEIVWRDIIIGHLCLWGCLALSIAACHSVTSWGLLVALMVLFALAEGLALNFINLFLHEAVHYNLAHSKATNDLLANVFIGSLSGTDVRRYRPIHFDHHRYLGTDKDTEITYRKKICPSLFLKMLLGISVVQTLLLRQSYRNQSNEVNPKYWSTFAAFVVINAAVLYGCVSIHAYLAGVAWLIALFCFFPFFCALRQSLEHRTSKLAPEGFVKATTRIFKPGIPSSILGGSGFDRHLLHHMEPQISYTRLAELEAFLMDSPLKAFVLSRQSTYLETLKSLFAV